MDTPDGVLAAKVRDVWVMPSDEKTGVSHLFISLSSYTGMIYASQELPDETARNTCGQLEEMMASNASISVDIHGKVMTLRLSDRDTAGSFGIRGDWRRGA